MTKFDFAVAWYLLVSLLLWSILVRRHLGGA
jgi:hypothetical protein